MTPWRMLSVSSVGVGLLGRALASEEGAQKQAFQWFTILALGLTAILALRAMWEAPPALPPLTPPRRVFTNPLPDVSGDLQRFSKIYSPLRTPRGENWEI